MVLSRTVSEKTAILVKNRNFSTLRVFNAHAKGVLLEILQRRYRSKN